MCLRLPSFRPEVAYTFSDAIYSMPEFIGKIRQAKSITVTFLPHVALLYSFFSRPTLRYLGSFCPLSSSVWCSEFGSSLVNLLGALGIERRHAGVGRFQPIVDWSSCLKIMDGCDRVATWYARVLATYAGAGRCRQIHGGKKKLTIVYPGGETLGATACTCIVRSYSAIHGAVVKA